MQARIRPRVVVSVVCILIAGASGTRAQAQQMPAELLNPPGTDVFVLPLRDNVYMISGAGGNITASVGVDGVLLVDTGRSQMAEEIYAAIQRIQSLLAVQGALVIEPTKRGGSETESRMPWHPSMSPDVAQRPIRHIINTSADPDHVGGNEYLAALGVTYTSGNVAGAIADAAEGAAILAHENVMNRMVLAERSFASLPTLTFFNDQFKFRTYFNGEGVRVVHFPNAHTDGDSIVYFHGSDVVSAGDVFSMTSFPVIDTDNGGHINGILAALNYVIDLAMPEFRTEGGTMIIPGHGRAGDSADVTYYRDMLTIIRDRVQNMIDADMSLREIQAAEPTLGYNSRWGSDDGSWTTEMFVEALYLNLTEGS